MSFPDQRRMRKTGTKKWKSLERAEDQASGTQVPVLGCRTRADAAETLICPQPFSGQSLLSLPLCESEHGRVLSASEQGTKIKVTTTFYSGVLNAGK